MTVETDQTPPAKIDLLILALALIAISISTLLWVSHNQTPPSWDPADHLRFACEYYTPLSRLQLSTFYCRFFNQTQYYAPFYHMLTAGLFLITGPGFISATLVNLGLLGLAMLAIYDLGRKWYGRTAGLTAAILMPCYHINAALMHEYFIDFALMCWVAISLWVLDYVGDFRNTKKSIIFGLSLSMGMLCKQTFLFFLVLPTAYCFIKALWFSPKEERRLRFENIIRVLVVATLVSAFWYAPHLQDVRRIYAINQAGAIDEHDPPVFSYFSNLTYLHNLASEQLQVPFCGLFIFGFLLSLIFYPKKSITAYLTIIGGIGIFTLIANKDVRYTMPCLSAVALLSCCWLARLRPWWLAIAPMLLIVVFAGFALINAQWPKPGEGEFYRSEFFIWRTFGRNYLNYDRYPNKNDWAFGNIFELLTKEAPRRGAKVRVGMATNMVHLNPSAFALYSYYWHRQHPETELKTRWLVKGGDINSIGQCHFVILRDHTPSESWLDKTEDDFIKWVKDHPERFKRLAAFPLQDLGANIEVYEQLVIEENNNVEQVCLLGGVTD